jgi:nucleoside-diphosphate kinase
MLMGTMGGYFRGRIRKTQRTMAGNRTFTMIKPEAVAAGHAGKILDMIIGSGFRVVSLKYTRLSHKEAGAFYEVHMERPFYG